MLEPQFQELFSQNDSLSPWRKKYWEKFRELGSLSLKHEAFQYVSLSGLELPKAAKMLPIEKIRQTEHGLKIVFIDGFYSPEHSVLPEDVIGLPIDEAIRSYGVFLQNRMVRTMKEEIDPFAALNGAFQGRGFFLYVPPKKKIEETIHIEHFFTGPVMVSPRIMINLGKQSKLQLEQHWYAEEKDAYFANAHVDVVLDEGSDLVFKTVQLEALNSYLFQSLRASLKRDSSFVARMYSEGARTARHSWKVQLLEENAQALLEGVTLLEKEMQSHMHALVEHIAPNAKSRQHFKALLKDGSRSSFEGKIFVHSEAQKTESYQLSNNLLLSDQAQAYAKPNLEIFADDVKASHGATVSQLDPEILFYLKSRGLSELDAKDCLIRSFTQELAACLPEIQKV